MNVVTWTNTKPVGCELPGVEQYSPGGQPRHWEEEEAPDSGRKLPTGQGVGEPLA